MTPEFSFYDDYFDEIGEFHLWFSLPPFNVNGELIHTDNYYYTIYVDDEPYVFEGDVYTVLGDMGISEITDLPYSMDLGGGLVSLGIYRGVVLLCGGMDKIEVKAYLLIDGEKYYSEPMTLSFSGIDKVSDNDEVVSSEYYNLDGTKANADTKGIIICKSIMADGSVKVTKAIK